MSLRDRLRQARPFRRLRTFSSCPSPSPPASVIPPSHDSARGNRSAHCSEAEQGCASACRARPDSYVLDEVRCPPSAEQGIGRGSHKDSRDHRHHLSGFKMIQDLSSQEERTRPFRQPPAQSRRIDVPETMGLRRSSGPQGRRSLSEECARNSVTGRYPHDPPLKPDDKRQEVHDNEVAINRT